MKPEYNEEFKENPDDYIIFIVNNAYYFSTKQIIRKAIHDRENIRYECLALKTMRPENIVRENPIIQVRSFGLPVQYIYLGELLTLLDLPNHIYKINKTNKELASTVSQTVLDGGSQLSASHCQGGQGGFIYSLEICNDNNDNNDNMKNIIGGKRTKKSRKSKKSNKSVKSRKSKKSKKTKKSKKSKKTKKSNKTNKSKKMN
ncbi:hypothetical protein N8459_02470 [Nitrosopumilus sp.]|nr:hypothetical protein [Nitrosopumilus sp.]